jgi:uncharacterized protein YggT (Ycf19 family)
MGLIELALGFCFTLLLVRALVPDEGQAAFNPLYRTTIALTRPALDRIRRLIPQAGRTGPVLLMALIVAFQGLLYLLSGPSGRRVDLVLRPWFFVGISPLSCWAKAAVFYLSLIFRLLAFAAVILALQRPENSCDQISRLFREALSPADRLCAKNRFALPGLLVVLFAVALALFWKAFSLLGLLPGETMLPLQSLLIAAAVFAGLSSVFALLIFAQALLSWLPLGGFSGSSGAWLASLTEPLIAPFRRFHLRFGQWDLTPMAAIAALLIGRGLAMIILAALLRWTVGL